jgi:hypothetical protein
MLADGMTWRRTLGLARYDQRLLAPAGVALVALLVRLVPAWLLNAEVNDIQAYRTMGLTVLRGDNIYAHSILFPYSPFSQFQPAWSIRIAELTGWGLDFVIKLHCILADTATTAIIIGFLLWRGLSLGRAALWGLVWALNPVSILISAFHGNIMAVTPFLVLSAAVAVTIASERQERQLLLAIAALLLGLGIALRTYPLLLLPAFLLLATRTIREAAGFALLAALPAALSSLPYLIFARQTFLQEVLSYGGFTDFGWVAVLRSTPYLLGKAKLFAFDGELMTITRRLFLIGYIAIALTFPYFRPQALIRALLLAPLLFYAVYAGVGAQYYVWVLPLAIVLRERIVLIYSIVAAITLTAFYASYAPGILVGRFGMPPLDDRQVTLVYTGGNVVLVLLCLYWLGRILLGEWRAFAAVGWSAAMPWVQRLRGLWTSPVYHVALVVLCVIWLVDAGRVVSRAHAVMQALLR